MGLSVTAMRHLNSEFELSFKWHCYMDRGQYAILTLCESLSAVGPASTSSVYLCGRSFCASATNPRRTHNQGQHHLLPKAASPSGASQLALLVSCCRRLTATCDSLKSMALLTSLSSSKICQSSPVRPCLRSKDSHTKCPLSIQHGMRHASVKNQALE